jgi:hypothetical protein
MTVIISEAEALTKLFREHGKGMSLKEFGKAHRLGSGPMVWQYLHAKRGLSLIAALRFARAFNVELSKISPRFAEELGEVLGNAGDKLCRNIPSALPSDDYQNVRCVEFVLKTGSPHYETRPLLPQTSTIAFRRDWLTRNGLHHDKLLAIECNDEGMQPTMFRGDLVVVNTTDVILTDGDTFSINDGGRLRVRRVFLESGEWWMVGDNKDPQRYPKKCFTKEHCFTLGKIVHRQSEKI